MGKKGNGGAFYDTVQSKRFRECVDDVKKGRSSIKGLKRNYQIQSAMHIGDNGGKGEAISRILNGHKELDIAFAQNFIDNCYPELQLSYLLGRSNCKFDDLEHYFQSRCKSVGLATGTLFSAAGATDQKFYCKEKEIPLSDLREILDNLNNDEYSDYDLYIEMNYCGERFSISFKELKVFSNTILHITQGELLRMLHLHKISSDDGRSNSALEALSVL